MWQSILALIKLLPAFISLCVEVWKAIKAIQDHTNDVERAKELKGAIKDASKTKNTSRLEHFFDPSKSLNDGSK